MRFINKPRFTPETISKIVEPTIATPGNDGYNSLGNKKQALLVILIKEQSGLCAYCNQSINEKTATVEHLICQNHNTAFDLNYHNLYAVCNGNEGNPKTQHCDKYRANAKRNDYFVPFMLFRNCQTVSWDRPNPFFDVEFNRRTGVVSGKIIPKQENVKGFPSVQPTIGHAIETLNLNAEVLVTARKARWEAALNTKKVKEHDWKQLFAYYLEHREPTDFHEFVLLAIRKQE